MWLVLVGFKTGRVVYLAWVTRIKMSGKLSLLKAR